MIDWPENPEAESSLLLEFTDGSPANYRQTLVEPVRFVTYGNRDDVLVVQMQPPFELSKWQVHEQQFETNKCDYCFLATRIQGQTLFDRIVRPVEVYVLLPRLPVSLGKSVLEDEELVLQYGAVLSPKY